MDSSSCLGGWSSDSEKRPPRAALQRVGSGVSAVLDPTPEGSAETESSSSKTKLPSSRYKGVVPQPNGRWGAQIYERHQRVWLGTFADEAEAARAYDVAAQRFRGSEAVTNFRRLSDSDGEEGAELGFLKAHSKAEIVDMLRRHTYREELRQSARRRARCGDGGNKAAAAAAPGDGSPSPPREMLFEKTVTPSDVGKLNRLVVPKQHAEKHFPLRWRGGSGGADVACRKGVLLNLEDGGGRVWRFRYSYWNSSQSYVLTKGWSRFVKEKNLKAGDVVGFLRSTGPEKQLYIDYSTAGAAVVVPPPATPLLTTVMLFGVNISGSPAGSSRNGKRERDPMQLLPSSQQLSKKQLIEAL